FIRCSSCVRRGLCHASACLCSGQAGGSAHSRRNVCRAEICPWLKLLLYAAGDDPDESPHTGRFAHRYRPAAVPLRDCGLSWNPLDHDGPPPGEREHTAVTTVP